MDIYGYHAGKLGVRRFTSVNVETSPYLKIYLNCLKNMGFDWKECYDKLFSCFCFPTFYQYNGWMKGANCLATCYNLFIDKKTAHAKT